MADYTAQEYIQLQKLEESNQSNIRNLWQETGDQIYPYVQITTTYQNGIPRTTTIYDMTPYLDMCDMVSGLKYILMPSGQYYFAVKTSKELSTNDNAQRYLSLVTEIAHEKIASSNFITEFDEVLRNEVIFGPGTIFSEWIRGIGLNYKATEIGTYQLLEDNTKNVDSIFVKFQLTARNAKKEFGSNVGKSVSKALEKCETENNKFWFIHCVKPRKNRNYNFSDNANMPFESVFVNVIDEIIVDEGGFPENPYHTARWMRPCGEKDGRGIGTEGLPQIRVLNKMSKTFIEVGNKWGDPPLEVVTNDVEGDVDTRPGALTHVMRRGSVGAIEQNALGNFPITEKSLDRQTDLVHRMFFKNTFSPLEDLTGDRRTTLEIRERIKQSWPKIGPPVTRIWFEQLTKCITRSILLLIRNGEIPYPPPELAGANFGIEFVGPFALELRSSQAKAFQEWVGWIGQMEQAFPNSVERPSDYLDMKDAIPRMGRTFGVNSEDMASEEEVMAKQQQRIKEMQQMQAMQAAQVASQAYNQTTGAPEQGSPAGAMMGTK